MTRKPNIAARRSENPRLIALLNGSVTGEVYQDRSGRLQFIYDDEWRHDADAYPLSLSMPLAAQEHKHEVITAFLWGLLPENAKTLDQYGRIFGVSSANPIALLSHIGADCAGAVQFAPPELIDSLLGVADAPAEVEWLTEDEVAAELRIVREQGIPGTSQRTVGQFSLAGAQPKIALLAESGQWGKPRGRTPTNRILKPPSKDFHGFAENEHFCLALAGALNLGSVESRVLRFSDEVAIVVERFDRVKRGNTYHRIHQEDVCQALGVMPTRKYQNEGGPGILEVISLLRDASRKPEDDIDRFLSAIALNWVIAATDGHAKNYALLHGPRAATRLAPFYDIASYLPYAEPALHRVRVAMKIGGEYLVRRIDRGSWQALSRSLGIPEADLLGRIEALVRKLAAAVEEVRHHCLVEGLEEPVIDGLAMSIRGRAESCLEALRP